MTCTALKYISHISISSKVWLQCTAVWVRIVNVKVLANEVKLNYHLNTKIYLFSNLFPEIVRHAPTKKIKPISNFCGVNTINGLVLQLIRKDVLYFDMTLLVSMIYIQFCLLCCPPDLYLGCVQQADLFCHDWQMLYMP